MNEVKLFDSEEFGLVRTVIIDGDPWFVGRDVAKALGYAKPEGAVATHCRHTLKRGIGVQTGMRADGTPSMQTIDMLVIPEGDVYRLITRSQLPSAEKFESWVMDEVIPAIRKTGTYSMTEKPDSYMIEDPRKRAERWIEEYEEKKQLEEKVAILSPKAEMCDKILDASMLVNFRDAAKEIGISQSQFTGWLKENGYVYTNSAGELRPMEPYMKSDFFQMKPYQNPYNGYKGSRTYITGRGLAAFKKLIDSEGHNRDTMKKHGGRKKK